MVGLLPLEECILVRVQARQFEAKRRTAGASEARGWIRRDEVYAKHSESPAFAEKAKGIQARQKLGRQE